MQNLGTLNTSFSRSIKNLPFEVVFGVKPNDIPKILGETSNEVRLEGGVYRTDEGSKANLEENLSKTSKQTDERSEEAQQSCEEIKRNHDAFTGFSYHNKRDNRTRASPEQTSYASKVIKCT